MCAFSIFKKKNEKIPNRTEDIEPLKWRKGDLIANRYEIFKILGGEGKSGMGIVYICYDHEHKNLFALKTFQDNYLISKGAQEQFKKEALVWTHLEKYPYIVKAHWVDKLSGRLFIVLEYVAPDESGRNALTHYLEKLSFVQTLKFAIQFCYGMEYAYSKGIDVHRDIKPDNIMITLNQMVKITDFGLAKSLSEIETVENIGIEPGNKLTIFKSQGKGVCGTPP
ncbi:MAG: protein kinase, partial [Anaerolineales bacterium]|nr:protein kinase [Anaerolineales bacterium]